LSGIVGYSQISSKLFFYRKVASSVLMALCDLLDEN